MTTTANPTSERQHVLVFRPLPPDQLARLQAVHQVDLDGGVHRLLFVLQAVARAHFHQGDTVWNHGCPFEVCELSCRDIVTSRAWRMTLSLAGAECGPWPRTGAATRLEPSPWERP